MYCGAVVLPLNTVISSPLAEPESLVQVTVVAGPSVEIQVRVNRRRVDETRVNHCECHTTRYDDISFVEE